MRRAAITRRMQLVGVVGILAMLAAGAAVAASTGTGTVDPPPRIAFVADAFNPADALAAGPTAGRLGAPLFTTPGSSLSAAAGDGLAAYGPELVVVVGGPAAISDGVVNEIAARLGLPVITDGSQPDTGIVRAAGAERTATAVAIADLIDAYAPAFLPVDATAVHALQADSAATAGSATTADAAATAADASLLDGRTAAEIAATPPDTWMFANETSLWIPSDVDDHVAVQVDLPDPCGGGTTHHVLRADLASAVYESENHNSLARLSLQIDAETPVAETEAILYGTAGEQRVPLSLSWVFTDVSPGLHDVHAVAAQPGNDYSTTDVVLVVQHQGWTCS